MIVLFFIAFGALCMFVGYHYGSYFAEPVSKYQCREELQSLVSKGVIDKYQRAVIIRFLELKDI
jgi:hypothetical protein